MRVGRSFGEDGRSGGADALALAHLLASRDHRDLVIVSAQFDSPVRGLIEAALANGAGTIVIGSSHRSLPGRVLPGSVGSRLLCDSPCSITLAPAGYGLGRCRPLTVVDDDAPRMRREAAELDLAALIESIPAGLDADAEVLEGPAATVVVAGSRRFDLLVLGSRSHGPIRRVLVGSVSGPVSPSAHCPLRITPRSAVMARPAPGKPRRRPPRVKALDDFG